MGMTFEKFGYIASGDSSADVSGDWIDCLGVDIVAFFGILDANINGASCKIEGTNDPTFGSDVFVLATQSSLGNLGPSIQLSAGATTALPRWVRLTFFHGSGGAADQLHVSAVGRARN